MTHLPLVLALVSDFEDVVSVQPNVFTSGMSEGMLIFGAVAAVVVLSFVGVFVFRKRILRRRRKHHRHRMQQAALSAKTGASLGKAQGKRRRVRRKRRRRNPTLAETGGLPPNRNEQSSASPSS